MTRPTGSLDYLDPYALDVGDRVLVELLVTDNVGAGQGPRQIAGAVKAASNAVLVLEQPYSTGTRLVRVPWQAVATIADEDPTPKHPGL